MRCQGSTKTGQPCKNKAIEGTSFCKLHTSKSKKKSKKSVKKISKKSISKTPIGIADPLTLKSDTTKKSTVFQKSSAANVQRELTFAQKDWIGEQIGERENKVINTLTIDSYRDFLYTQGTKYYQCGWNEQQDAFAQFRLANSRVVGYQFTKKTNHVTQNRLDSGEFSLMGDMPLVINFRYYNIPDQIPIPKPIGFTRCEDSNNAITWEVNESKSSRYSEKTDIGTQLITIANFENISFEEKVIEAKRLIVSCLFQMAYFVHCFAQEKFNIRIGCDYLVAVYGDENDFQFQLNNQTTVFHSYWSFAAFKFRDETGEQTANNSWVEFLIELQSKIPNYFKLEIRVPPYPDASPEVVSLSQYLKKSERGNQRFKDDDKMFDDVFAGQSKQP